MYKLFYFDFFFLVLKEHFLLQLAEQEFKGSGLLRCQICHIESFGGLVETFQADLHGS